MDLTTRKNKFIEQFMKIASIEKLEHFEELLRVETAKDNVVVVNTIDGIPITKKQYILNNQEAVDSFKKGDYKTQSQMRQKYAVK